MASLVIGDGTVTFGDGSVQFSSSQITTVPRTTLTGNAVTINIDPDAYKVDLLIKDVKFNNTDDIHIILGGGLYAIGYLSTSIWVNSASGTSGSTDTTGFRIRLNGNTGHGRITLTRYSVDKWVGDALTTMAPNAGTVFSATSATIGAVTSILITSVNNTAIGAGYFTAGTIEVIQYRTGFPFTWIT